MTRAPRWSPSTRMRRLVASAGFTALLAVSLVLAGAVLRPARPPELIGGAWHSFLTQEPRSLDVVTLGTSHVFTSIDPAVIWRTEGIPSFTLSGPTQRLEVTYHYIRQVLRTQRPRVIALEVIAATYGPTKCSPEYHRINVGGMPWGPDKIAAIVDATPDGERIAVACDLWSYHGRWNELTLRDLDVLGKDTGHEYLRGFLPRACRPSEETSGPPAAAGARPMLASRPVPPASPSASGTGPGPAGTARAAADPVPGNLRELRRIAELCRDENVKLVLFLTPTRPLGAYSYVLRRVRPAVAGIGDVRVLDLGAPGAVPGLSIEGDFYDDGHLGWSGADKTSRALARYLAAEYRLPDRRRDPRYRSWASELRLRDEFVEGIASGRIISAPPE